MEGQIHRQAAANPQQSVVFVKASAITSKINFIHKRAPKVLPGFKQYCVWVFGCFNIASPNKDLHSVHAITNVAMLRMKQFYHIGIVKQAKALAKEKQ